MGPDSDESVEDQVTESSESGGEPEADTSFAEVREGNVDEVVAYAGAHPDEAEELAAAEAGGKDRKGVREGIEKGISDAEQESADSEPPGARARAEGEAERAQRLAEARHAGEPDEVDTADLVCEVHGGELRQTSGKYRWICDRTQTPGECVAGYRS